MAKVKAKKKAAPKKKSAPRGQRATPPATRLFERLKAALEDSKLRRRWLNDRAAVLAEHGISSPPVAPRSTAMLAAVFFLAPWPPFGPETVVVQACSPFKAEPGTIDLVIDGAGFEPGSGFMLVGKPKTQHGTGLRFQGKVTHLTEVQLRGTITIQEPGLYDVVVGKESDSKPWVQLLDGLDVRASP